MANVKNITELPLAESAEGLNLIVNDGGSAKQIAASAVGAQADWSVADENSPAFIKNKPSKELVYEWSPGVDSEGNPVTDIIEFVQNVDDDLSWITRYNSSINFEIEAYLYGCIKHEYVDDNGDNQTEIIVDATCDAMLIVDGKSQYYTERRKNDRDEICYAYAAGSSWDTPSYGNLDCPYFDIAIYNNKHIDENYNYTDVETGGSFEMYFSDCYPIKMIRIYKITN